MKAISLWQPWASLIGRGKSIETRSWSTSHRGPIAIHAAKRFTAEEVETCETAPFFHVLKDAGFAQLDHNGLYMRMMFPFGAIVATANLVDCVRSEIIRPKLAALGQWDELAFGNYQTGRWAWIMSDIRPLKEPIRYTGRQQLFDIPDDIFGEEAK